MKYLQYYSLIKKYIKNRTFISTMSEVENVKRVKLDQFPALLRDCVHMRNKEHVENLINELVKGGAEKLQFISDFDQTMTKQHMNGQRCLSSFGVFGHCPQLPQNYREQSQALFNQYRPIEIDPEMSVEEKIPHMVEWYEKAQDLLTGFPLPQTHLDNVMHNICLELRNGTVNLLSHLNKADVPMLVFSAGLGDMVAAILRYHSALLPNVHIISNFLQYDGDTLCGFKGQIIHTFNKNEHAIENSDYFSLLTGRSNVILLGDSEGDARMAEGVKDSNAVLKIGFLYERVEESLNTYLDIYDIVLVDDQTMDVPNQLLDVIFKI
ncbi:hypothetical protein R5R35_006331 [Gryllus longicercus]|uniref:5'-nucleotidase n=3 Tax=Gryllus longicercus TaxID=2509291 RepID=A0AAN9VBV2_9ORTH